MGMFFIGMVIGISVTMLLLQHEKVAGWIAALTARLKKPEPPK